MRSVDLCDELYRELSRDIVSMKLLPGQMISENSLCERFSVSRTPIRSVLQRLSHCGLVEIAPHKYTRVTLIDYDILNQIIYERVAVESMIFRDFVLNHTQAEKDQVAARVEEMRTLYTTNRVVPAQYLPQRFFDLDRQMHKLWFQSTGNLYLWESFENALANYNRFCMLDIESGGNTADVMAEHEELLALLDRQDIAAIEPLIRRHFRGGLRRLQERIFTDFAPYFSNLPDTPPVEG